MASPLRASQRVNYIKLRLIFVISLLGIYEAKSFARKAFKWYDLTMPDTQTPEKNVQTVEPTIEGAGPYLDPRAEHNKISHLTVVKPEQQKIDNALGIEKAGAAALEDQVGEPISVMPQAMEPAGEIHPNITSFAEYQKKKLEHEKVINQLKPEDSVEEKPSNIIDFIQYKLKKLGQVEKKPVQIQIQKEDLAHAA